MDFLKIIRDGLALLLWMLATGAVIALAAGLLFSCRMMKRSHKEQYLVRYVDSMVIKQRDSVVYRTRDTAIGVAGSSVAVLLPEGSLDSTGVVRKIGRTTLRAHRNMDGSLQVECLTDSLTIVINDLESKIVLLRRDYQRERDSIVNSRVVTDKVVKSGGGLWKWFAAVAVGFIVGLVLVVRVYEGR